MTSHAFPVEEIKPEIRQKWIDFCQPENYTGRDRILFSGSSRLCGLHFAKDAKHLNPNGFKRAIVKKDGCPTIHDVKSIAEQMVRDYLVEKPDAIFNHEAEKFLGMTSPVPNRGNLLIPILDRGDDLKYFLN